MLSECWKPRHWFLRLILRIPVNIVIPIYDNFDVGEVSLQKSECNSLNKTYNLHILDRSSLHLLHYTIYTALVLKYFSKIHHRPFVLIDLYIASKNYFIETNLAKWGSLATSFDRAEVPIETGIILRSSTILKDSSINALWIILNVTYYSKHSFESWSENAIF